MRHEFGSESAKLSQIQHDLSLMSSLHYFKWKQKKVLKKTQPDLSSVQLSSLLHRDHLVSSEDHNTKAEGQAQFSLDLF